MPTSATGHAATTHKHCLLPMGSYESIEAAHVQFVGTDAKGEGDGKEGTAGPVYLPHACAGRSLNASEDFCHLLEVLKVQLDW